ncbi:MAG: hypothetical protein ED557_10680 [Balneola sp.]|nr:MAG: hypothetical protein ED557_10680 [Balneola sp.]
MDKKITLNNLFEFSTSLESHSLKWMFEDANGLISTEFLDQIIPLNNNASQYLWNVERTQKQFHSIANIKKYFKKHSELKFANKEKTKKWLYQRGIPFDRQVFWVSQPDSGFIMTWKMIIKFSENLFFAHDVLVWDQSLNWILLFSHDDIFCFGEEFDSTILNKETETLTKLIYNFKSNK